MHLQQTAGQLDVDMMANIGAVAILELQQEGYGFAEYVDLLCAYRFAKNSCDIGGELDVPSVCTIGMRVRGLPADCPVPVLVKTTPVGGVSYLLRRLSSVFKPGARTDAVVSEFMGISPFASGNGRTAWIMQNWLDETLDDPSPRRGR